MSSVNFNHDGKPLAQWLNELTGESGAARTTAANVMSMFQLSDHAGFHVAVKQAVSEMSGGPAAYVERLGNFLIHAQTERMREFESAQKADELVFEQMIATHDPTARDALRTKLFSYEPPAAENDWITQQIGASFAFEALEELALTSPGTVRRLLLVDTEYHHVTKALLKAPAEGAQFLDELMNKLEKRYEWGSELYEATAALLRNDPKRTAGIIEWLDESTPRAISAAMLLGWIGPIAPKLVPVCLDKLVACASRAADNPARMAAIRALGKITSGTNAAVDLLLRFSREPDMWVRGAAISALGDTRVEPDRVVPRLIECFTDYEEPDPDCTYESAYLMVATALSKFGAHAGAAVPHLVERIYRADDGMLDKAVVEALGAIGLAAAAALPILEKELEANGPVPFLEIAITQIEQPLGH
jgi:HEAT repeat protein